MKNITIVSVLGILFLFGGLSVSRADDAATEQTAETGMSGTPQEMADLQKTLQNDNMDDLQQNVADLKQTVSALTNRVADLERTVFDDNSRQ